MLERGVIEPSKSPWASPVVIVTKKDNFLWFCCDYRLLNNVTVKDAYPLPRTDACLDAVPSGSARWTCRRDSGRSRWLPMTARRPPLPRRWACTSGCPLDWSIRYRHFSDVWRKFSAACSGPSLSSPSRTFTEGLERLGRIFDRLLEANLKLKPSECAFFQKKITFLGHVVSEEGISTDDAKIKAIKTWPTPKSVKDIKSFIGLASYYRRFVQGFSKIAKILHKLGEKGVKVVWTDEAQQAFDT